MQEWHQRDELTRLRAAYDRKYNRGPEDAAITKYNQSLMQTQKMVSDKVLDNAIKEYKFDHLKEFYIAKPATTLHEFFGAVQPDTPGAKARRIEHTLTEE